MGSAAVDVERRSPKAFRLVAGVLGVVLAILVVPYTVFAMVSDDPEQTIHRFHNTAGSTSTLIVVAALFVVTWRPGRNTASMQLLIVAAIVSVIAGLLGSDLVHGLYFLPGVFVAILYALDPWKPDVRHIGSLRFGVLGVAVVAAVPAVAYALTQAALQRHALPGDVHAQMDHYSGVALTALAMPATVAVAGLGTPGWRLVGRIGAAAFVVFGFAGVAYSTRMSAPEVGWAWASVVAGAATIVATEAEARRAAGS
jgi:hypothetical protein